MSDTFFPLENDEVFKLSLRQGLYAYSHILGHTRSRIMRKMKHAYRLLTMLMVLVFIASCSTLFTAGGGDYRQAKAYYENGDHLKALKDVLSALEANDDFPEAEELLQQIVKEGTQDYLAQIEEYRNKPYWDGALALYDKLNEMHELLSAAGRAEELSFRSYKEEEEELRTKVADLNYRKAVEYLKKGDSGSARKAASRFKLVNKYVEDYKDTAKLLEQAEEAAFLQLALQVNSSKGGFLETWIMEKLTDEYTEVIPAVELGISKGAAVSTLISTAQQNRLDMLIVVNADMSGELVDTVFEENVEVYDEIKGTRITFGFSQKLSAEVRAIDLDSSNRLVNETINKTHNESLAVTIINKSGEKQFDFEPTDPREGKGFTAGSYSFYEVADVEVTKEDKIEAARNFVKFEIPDNLDKIDNWREMRRVFNGMTWFADVELLLQPNGRIRGLYHPDEKENREFSDRSREITLLIEEKAPQFVEAYYNKFTLIETSAAEKIASMVKNSIEE